MAAVSEETSLRNSTRIVTLPLTDSKVSCTLKETEHDL